MPEKNDITAEEYAKLLKENGELKASLHKASEEKQELDKRNATLVEEARKANSATKKVINKKI
jgi:hypothetical protein